MGFLNGKRALIVGLATDRSIAWGIAQAMHREGAALAFSHIERMADRVVPLAKQLGIGHDLRHGRRERRGHRARLRASEDALGFVRIWCTRWRSRRARRSPATFIDATDARGVSRGARYFELQPDGVGARLAALHAGSRAARSSP